MSNPEIDKYGTKRWYVNGKPHRIDGPAVESFNGYKEWRVNGLYHRLDGPAIEWPDGGKTWYVNDKKISGPLKLLKHGTKLSDIAEYLTPREIAQIKLDK